MSAYTSHVDENQQFSITGVVGTAGTADTKGTAKVLPIGVNPDNGAMYTHDLNTAEESGTAFNGGTVAVGTTAVSLTFTGVTQSIMITASHSNSTTVYIGGSSVDSDGSAAITSIWPGESVSVDLDDTNAPLYACGAAVGQKVYKFGLT